MLIPAFDVVSTLTFTMAAFVCVSTILVSRRRITETASPYLLGATVVMAFVGYSNVIEHLGISAVLDTYEDFVEIMFLPFVTYMLFKLHTQGLAAKAAREREVVGMLGERLSESMAQLDEHRLSMLQALSAAVDARDHYTAQHSMHVADYACAIAYQMGLKDQLGLLEQAGLLHDIGKIGVPDQVLLKPARLNDEEYRLIKSHVSESAQIIGTVPFLAEVVPVVRHHHERWDGSGYPDRLAGESIPLPSRVLAVADAFDAMTTDRPYRLALSTEAARAQMLEGRGTQFDPGVVDALVSLLDSGIIAIDGRSEVA